MTEDVWSNDPRFSKSAAVPEFAGLRETVEKLLVLLRVLSRLRSR